MCIITFSDSSCGPCSECMPCVCCVGLVCLYLAWASYQLRITVLRMHRECRERFPRHQHQRKPLASDPGMHHGTCATHMPWCMSGSLTCGGGENVPGACATRNAMYLVIGTWDIDLPQDVWHHGLHSRHDFSSHCFQYFWKIISCIYPVFYIPWIWDNGVFTGMGYRKLWRWDCRRTVLSPLWDSRYQGISMHGHGPS